MEGPTPSIAVFYGALSIHAGAFVLLRAAPILEAAPAARLALAAMGFSTALFATMVGRVQTDIKSMLAFASLTQVSIILVEIALGWYDIALAHMVGHALFRLQQFLRSPSVLHDFHEATHATGGHRKRDGGVLERVLPERWHRLAYRFALERGSLDSALDRFVVHPFVASSGWFDRLERRWCARCAGRSAGPTRRRHDRQDVYD
jgi:NAD(P)H-quinone oxidoreductase subunit 5